MQLRFVWIGKTKNDHIRSLVDDYLSRLRRFVRCDITELRESKARVASEGIEDESGRIIGALRSDAIIVLLDIAGGEWSSPEVADQIKKWQLSGKKEVTFVIGGHVGVSAEVVAKADIRWSLSRLTLTHEMARVVMTEQLYRAYTIIHGLPYQK